MTCRRGPAELKTHKQAQISKGRVPARLRMQMLTELLAAARQDNIKLSHQITETGKQRLQDSQDAQDRQQDLLDQVGHSEHRLILPVQDIVTAIACSMLSE